MEIENVKGIGLKTSKILNKLGIITVEDMVNYYPYRFDVIERSNINELYQDDKIIMDGIVEVEPRLYFFNKKMNKMTLSMNSGRNIFNVTIFNRSFLKPNIHIGTNISVIGKYDKKHNTIIASDIKLSKLPDVPVIEPIYHATNGLSSNQIHKLITSSIPYIDNVIEYVPSYLKERYHLQDKITSIKEIHNPHNKISLKNALNYLKYEELFLFMMKMNSLKKEREWDKGIKRKIIDNDVHNFINGLPFKLTDDQNKCIEHIKHDMENELVMKRLVQGDVGSGKTIVAVVALYMNYLSGYQGAFMAPTEVLAEQHYKNLTNLFKDKLKVELLTGKLKAKERKDILKRLANNEIDILIGTHALFSEDVIYSKLGLVITDEQHRFGVKQRASLKEKGIKPDILYLSATPIPRTYAITLYGDMDISSIHTKPNGRLDIITKLYSNEEIKEVLSLMEQEIRNKHQIYVVAPLIEESDKIDLENVLVLKEKLTKALGKIANIEVLHGKMKQEEKESIMNSFKNNEIQILISTTVIEVGIDVANATVMCIFDSYRFGLSQLHQLRGRVGRSDNQSYCLLISDRESERLSVMTKTTDGFKIAEEDFKLRGSGDLFGTRQSGDMRFNLSDIKEDFNILLRAKEDSMELLNSEAYVNHQCPLLEQLLSNSTNLD